MGRRSQGQQHGRRGRDRFHSARGEMARARRRGRQSRPLVRNAHPQRGDRRADEKYRPVRHRARAAGHAGFRGQCDRDHRSRHPRPGRAQHRVRLEPGRIQCPRRHHRSGSPLRSGPRMVQDLRQASGRRRAVRLGRRVLQATWPRHRSADGAASAPADYVRRLLA